MTINEETHLLYDVIQFTNSIINNAVFDVIGSDDKKEVSFKTKYHYQFFYIGVLELIKKNSSKKSLIDKLADCSNFNNGRCDDLKFLVSDFNKWLYTSFDDKVLFLSFKKIYNLSLERYKLIYICANYSKHTISSLSSVIKMIKKEITKLDQPIEDGYIPFILREFYDYYNEGVLLYHSSVISQYLNDIRWAIHNYIYEEYEKSTNYKDNGRYEYKFPPDVKSGIDEYVYWELMNETRHGPYVNKFAVNEILRRRY